MLNNIKPIHPFAARMAPEIAFEALKGLSKGATVLDPMVGSGTVLRTVTEFGYKGIGFDIDPLAVLMSRVWTTIIDPQKLVQRTKELIEEAVSLDCRTIHLPWIDEDEETESFINFWFAPEQQKALRKLAFLLHGRKGLYSDVLKLVLSRQIITKTKGASLAADVSHSRPHRVRVKNDFNIFAGFEKTSLQLANNFDKYPVKNLVAIKKGDARRMSTVPDNSVASIITSPPYLNALDYMRGHKMALVWLGYSISHLANIRNNSVGAEKMPDEKADLVVAESLIANLCHLDKLSIRKCKMIQRYVLDMHSIIKESKRVLEKGSKATFVIGNSCLNGIYIENSKIVTNCAERVGLQLSSSWERDIPTNKRYLPPPTNWESSMMKNRMRTEVILSFIKPRY